MSKTWKDKQSTALERRRHKGSKPNGAKAELVRLAESYDKDEESNDDYRV